MEARGAGQHQQTRKLRLPANICHLWAYSRGLGSVGRRLAERSFYPFRARLQGVRFVEITSVNKPPRIVGVPEGSRSRHIRAEPVAGLQREFHVLPVIAHRSAETLLCLAAPASRKAKGVAQASVVLVVGCQARRRAEHPGPQQFLWIRASLRRLVNVRPSDQFTGPSMRFRDARIFVRPPSAPGSCWSRSCPFVMACQQA